MPSGPHAVLDPTELVPAFERFRDTGSRPPLRHRRDLLDSLVARGLVGGICEPTHVRGHMACSDTAARSEIALSPPKIRGDTLYVSALRRSLCTADQDPCIPFAVEFRYAFVLGPLGWRLARKEQTMIT